MKELYTDIGEVTKKVGGVVVTTERAIDPVRQSIGKRFPTLLIFITTFGVAATFFGIERLIMDVPWLSERPLVIFSAGILALFLSGKLYKKLG